MKIAIYETSLDGHRGPYLLSTTSEAVARGWKVTLIVPEREREHPLCPQLIAIVGVNNLVFSSVAIKALPSRTSPLQMLTYHLWQWRAARLSLMAQRRDWDFVYFPTLDVMDKAILILGPPSRPIPAGGMAMRVKFHLTDLRAQAKTNRPSFGSYLFSRLLGVPKLSVVTTADPYLIDVCKMHREPRYRKLRYVPELGMLPPLIDRATAKTGFGFEPNDRVILVFGCIDGRKAFAELVDAVLTQPKHTRLRVLIVGPPTVGAAAILSGSKYDDLRRAGILVTRLEFSDVTKQTPAFAAADVVWVAYRNHSTMSAVFYQAISCSKPVIAPNYGLISWLATNYDVGIQVNIDDPEGTGSAITKLFQDSARFDVFVSNARALSNSYLPQNFGAGVCDAIAAGAESSFITPAYQTQTQA